MFHRFMVMRNMSGHRHKFKIFNSIISRIMIYMMNYFRWKKPATNLLFHNKSVGPVSSAIFPYRVILPINIFPHFKCRAPFTLKVIITVFYRAKIIFISLYLRRYSINNFSTQETFNFYFINSSFIHASA